MADSDCSIVFEPHPTNYRNKPFVDMTGRVAGRLTVIGYAGKRGHNNFWFSRCECGKVKTVAAFSLQKNKTLSCGCLRSELTVAKNLIHGHAGNGRIFSPEYKTYRSTQSRCNCPYDKAYSRYGGRGIQFKFTSFVEFFEAIGPKPSTTHSIDRIDNNGHYETGNVRWATRHEQANNKRTTIRVTIDGVTKGLSEWLVCGSKQYRQARHQIQTKGREPSEVVKSLLSI